MTINPGDLVYIEASTGDEKSNGNWTIEGIYEIHKISDTNIWLIEESLIIKVHRDKITKIEKKNRFVY